MRLEEGTLKPKHEALPLRTVSRLTGLSADIIRAWERRYAVVAPTRGPRGARLYSGADVAHLRLLREVVGSGRAIGDVARLTPAELTALAAPLATTPTRSQQGGDVASDVVARMVDTLARFDEPALDRLLGEALMAFGTREFIRQVAKPLLEEVGAHWSDGRLSISDEHLLSALLRNLLTGVMRTRGQRAGASVLLTTPHGERHELGLLLAGLMVADAGLRLYYLGTDLPAAEIVSAAQRSRAAVVGLGVVNGDNQSTAVEEVRQLSLMLPPAVELWLGGREAAGVGSRLGKSRVVVLDEIDALERELARVGAHA
jgi:DNA-binding transcriptional MerR regulator/methylmalonyl-CoA mutase cobalamin-binding subunit